MTYKEITVLTNTNGSELVADLLYELGSEGVSIYDSNDLEQLLRSDIIWDYIDENLLIKNETVRVKACYPMDEYARIYPVLLEELEHLKSNSDNTVGSLEVSTAEIDDLDWVNEWRKYYKPIHVGDIVIVPKWLKYTKEPWEKSVYIDPGMAFGTGEHESTRLCLKLFGELDSKGKTVLDIGTGSGILGIAAAVSGAEKVYMSDIDSIAVEAARTNASLNNLNDNVIIEQGDLLEKASLTGDIVFANITADILIALSKNIGKCVKNGGYIILSGIIKARYEQVLAAYTDAGFKMDKSEILGEWCGMRLVK